MQVTALQALKLSWSIVPVKLDKRPYIKWETYQSTKPTKDMITRWHEEYNPPAWAVVTGAVSGRIVFDFDGDTGAATMRSLGLEPHLRTPSGGYHVHIEHPGFEVKTLNGKSKRELGRLYPGMDIRADGGYAVFCGRNEAGEYAWLREPVPDPIATLPVELRRYLGLEQVLEERIEIGGRESAASLLRTALEHAVNGRNDAGFWLACQLRDNGFSRSETEAVMREYQACVGHVNTKGRREPYTVDEALASLEQAFEHPAREPIQSVTIVTGKAEHPDADETEDLPVVRVRPWPSRLAPEAYLGLAGDFVRTVEPHTEADPVALLSSFLVAFGSAVGRSAYFVAEADRHYANLFAVQVGLSSKGRKGTSFGHIRRLFRDVDSDWESYRIESGLSSGEGLIWSVRDPIEKSEPIKENKRVVGYDSVIVDQGVSDKRLLIVEGEFASVLRVLGREGNTLSAVMRNAWDTGNLSSLTKNSPGRATGAHISIIGHITKDELLRYLDSTEAGNGFGNRFLWFCVERSKCLPEGGSLRESDLDQLVARLHEAVAFARKGGEIRRDGQARALWHTVYPELSDGKPGLLGAMIARSEAQVMRLACIYALLACSEVIRVEHLKAALALWSYCEESARYIFGDSLGDPMADELLKVLRETRGGMTRTEISRHFRRHKSAGQIARALSVLAERGLVRMEREDSSEGRPAERWLAVRTTEPADTTCEKGEKSERTHPNTRPDAFGNAVVSHNSLLSQSGTGESQCNEGDDDEWVEI